MDYGDYGDYGDKCGILYIHGMFPMISDICKYPWDLGFSVRK